MELKFKKLQEDAVLPSYANPNKEFLFRFQFQIRFKD